MIYHTAEEYIETLRSALSHGDFGKAQQLSNEAIEHYPEHEDIKKYVHILQPARATVTKRTDIDREGLQKSREWVRQQRINRNYLNQWVAVRNGDLLATGKSIDELIEQVGDTNNVFLTVIY